MITATILDADFSPIGGADYRIIDDEFQEVEDAAKAFAAAGTKCCIQWHREDDGMTAYYGLKGCQINPYWYPTTSGRGGPGRGQGRKPVAEGQVTVTASIRMTEAQRDKLDALGGAPWVRRQIGAASLPEK